MAKFRLGDPGIWDTFKHLQDGYLLEVSGVFLSMGLSHVGHFMNSD